MDKVLIDFDFLKCYMDNIIIVSKNYKELQNQL